jgi:RND family efflux transporter MFP subunit
MLGPLGGRWKGALGCAAASIRRARGIIEEPATPMRFDPHSISVPRGLLVILSLASAILASGCGKDEAPAAEEPVILAVKTLTIGGAGSGETREYTGSLAAWQHAEMAFEVSGKIIEFSAVEGQRVEAGYVLARLDPRDFEAGLTAAKANVAQANADFERFSILFEKGVASKAEYEAKKQRFEVTESELRLAVKALEDADLTAPFAGVMARKLVDDFQNVIAKEPVLILQDETHYKIRVTVPEQDMAGGRPEGRDLDEVTRRLEPRVTITSLPDRAFDASLYELSMTADPVTRTFDATFLMDPPEDVRILPGMTAKVAIRVRREEQRGFSVPGVAVWADEAGTSYVWKVDPQTKQVAKTSVELGAMAGSKIQIVEGLSPGDVIATSGVQALTEGSVIRPLGERLR